MWRCCRGEGVYVSELLRACREGGGRGSWTLQRGEVWGLVATLVLVHNKVAMGKDYNLFYRLKGEHKQEPHSHGQESSNA